MGFKHTIINYVHVLVNKCYFLEIYVRNELNLSPASPFDKWLKQNECNFT